MTVTQGTVFDIVLAAYLLLSIVRGWYVGLALKAAHLAAFIAAGIGAQVLAKLVGILPLYGVFFVVLLFVLYHLVKVVDVVNWLPIVGTVNRLGGAVLGFVTAFLWCYLIFSFLGAVVPQHVWSQWGLTRSVIANTYLLQIFLK